jgi:poly-gamma-glutamate capsule biosynthesis protein CapA/YwtB (metallophosphatase superfamily)
MNHAQAIAALPDGMYDVHATAIRDLMDTGLDRLDAAHQAAVNVRREAIAAGHDEYTAEQLAEDVHTVSADLSAQTLAAGLGVSLLPI